MLKNVLLQKFYIIWEASDSLGWCIMLYETEKCFLTETKWLQYSDRENLEGDITV